MGIFSRFFLGFFSRFLVEGRCEEGRKEGGTALFALSDARLLLLRSKKGACQLANAFDCLLHFAFTSAPQQYTKERNVTRAAAAPPPTTTTNNNQQQPQQPQQPQQQQQQH